MSKRDEALTRGDLKYWPDKACRKGHVSERYTSNGMCCACLGETASKVRAARTLRSKERERLLCKDIVQAKMNVPFKYISNTILQTIERLLAAPNGDQFCTWLEMIDRCPLGYDQLVAITGWDGNTAHANHFARRTDDAGGLEVVIAGNWYSMDEIMEVLRMQRPHVERIREAL